MSKNRSMSEEKYKKWVDKVFQYIEKVYDRVNQLEYVNVGSTQYIPQVDGDIELVFLGHDAHEGRGVGEKLDITNAKNRFFFRVMVIQNAGENKKNGKFGIT